MPLKSGSRLGPYEIVSAIGAGGMGEVSTAGCGLLRQQYTVPADGRRFPVNAISEEAAAAPITIIASWRGFDR
jgi:hypothetical protein